MKNKTSGFIAITATLIITSLTFVLGMAAFHFSYTEYFVSKAQTEGIKSDSLVEACSREAFLRLGEDINYSGYNYRDIEKEEVFIDDEECDSLEVKDISNNEKEIHSLVVLGEEDYTSKQVSSVNYLQKNNLEDWSDVLSNQHIEVSDNLTLDQYQVKSEDIIPAMTGNNSPESCAISTENSNSNAYLAFDDDYSTIVQLSFPSWVKISFSEEDKEVSSYSIFPENWENFNLDHTPKEWELYGSNNGTDWELIDSVSGETNWNAGEEKHYLLDSTKSFSDYRINFLSANNSEVENIEIAEIEMYEESEKYFSEGEIITPKYNLLSDYEILRGSWSSVEPEGTDIDFNIRFCNENVYCTDWEELKNNTIKSNNKKILNLNKYQVKINFSQESSKTPQLDDFLLLFLKEKEETTD